jgi:hypothetical protein
VTWSWIEDAWSDCGGADVAVGVVVLDVDGIDVVETPDLCRAVPAWEPG